MSAHDPQKYLEKGAEMTQVLKKPKEKLTAAEKFRKRQEAARLKFIDDMVKESNDKGLDLCAMTDAIQKEMLGVVYYEALHSADAKDRIAAAKEVRKSIPEAHELGTSFEDMLESIRAKALESQGVKP